MFRRAAVCWLWKWCWDHYCLLFLLFHCFLLFYFRFLWLQTVRYGVNLDVRCNMFFFFLI
jgi:hypothetical protein